jgi:putative FmdB family regulatory protein
MPTYDYKCDACDHAFEQFQSIKSDALRKCPKCGKTKLRRLIGSGAGLLFKGNGFYITDYRSESYKSSAKKDAPSSSTTSSGGGESKSSAASSAPPPSTSSGQTKKQPASKSTD